MPNYRKICHQIIVELSEIIDKAQRAIELWEEPLLTDEESDLPPIISLSPTLSSFPSPLPYDILGEKNKEDSGMHAWMIHNNFNVLHLEKSLDFYQKALGLTEVRRKEAADGSFILVYLGDGRSSHQLELTWLKDRKEPYNLGENEFHLAFEVDDYEKFHQLHQEMGCICFENPSMGIYFISDPDHYWLEILPSKK